jgi:hypothetical protein
MADQQDCFGRASFANSHLQHHFPSPDLALQKRLTILTLRLPAHWREEAALAVAKAGDEATLSFTPYTSGTAS